LSRGLQIANKKEGDNKNVFGSIHVKLFAKSLPEYGLISDKKQIIFLSFSNNHSSKNI